MAAGAILASFGLGGGWIFRLSGRLSQADAKADAAAKDARAAALTVASLSLQLDQTKLALVEHRVSVAREYVSTTTLAAMEEKLIKAVDRFGDRLDSLFTAKGAAANA
jgi:hypothetical protein